MAVSDKLFVDGAAALFMETLNVLLRRSLPSHRPALEHFSRCTSYSKPGQGRNLRLQ